MSEYKSDFNWALERLIYEDTLNEIERVMYSDVSDDSKTAQVKAIITVTRNHVRELNAYS